jgi:hypothetical protein
MLLGGIAAGGCYAAAHVSLGLFLGPLLLSAVIIPPIALSHEARGERAIAVLSVVLGIWAVWCVATWRSPLLNARQSIECGLVLAAFALALSGLAASIQRVVRSTVFANAVVIILALLWLTWPVWAARSLADAEHSAERVAWLVPAHPPLVISTIVDLGVWGEQRVAYHLTTLGQDIVYRPPSGPWIAVAVHALLGIALLLAARKSSAHVGSKS